MKISLIGLLALSTISLIAIPAFADQANVQTSGQVSTQVGDNNNSTQKTTQSNLDSRRGRTENTGNAQDSSQDSFQRGNGNDSSQTTNQRNVVQHDRR
jgi:hypothetical protein